VFHRPPFSGLRFERGLFAICALLLLVTGARAHEALELKIVGGLGAVAQYREFEEPFWTREIEHLSDGSIRATIAPFDRSGLSSEDLLPLLRLGVVPFATVLAAVASADEPELAAVDLPGLNPDIATLRRVVAAFRPRLSEILSSRYDAELLAVYTYPAQVLLCRTPFSSFEDLRGRRIRTSSASQSDFVSGLGAVGVVIPFAELREAFQADVVDCVITSASSGRQIGVTQLASHMHAMALSWGISLFAANHGAWRKIQADRRDTILRGLSDLESRIWDAAARETALPFECALNTTACEDPAGLAHMLIVPRKAEDERERERLLAEVLLPRWLDRCGSSCGTSWNRYIAPVVGSKVPTR
jgi:TRAP-type C4-dicarboxylate transport system substrate-binding protein